MQSNLINDSKNRSDTQFIRDILASAQKYKNDLNYNAFASGEAYNSNSYVRGILKDAGIESAELPSWHWYPGWDKSISVSLDEACDK